MSNNMRVKLVVLPYEERLCILCKESGTIGDLKANVYHAVQFYSIYKEYLAYCTIHLEIKIDGACYGIPDNYVVRDCVTANDTFVVSFVDQMSLTNRQGIHIPAQTLSDIQYKKIIQMSLSPQPMDPYSRQNVNQSQNQQSRLNPFHSTSVQPMSGRSASLQPPTSNGCGASYSMNQYPNSYNREELEQKQGQMASEFDISSVNIAEIKHWIQSYMGSRATVHPAYHCKFNVLVDRLSGKFPKLRSVTNWYSFFTQHCMLNVAKTADGQIVQCAATDPETERTETDKVEKTNKSRRKRGAKKSNQCTVSNEQNECKSKHDENQLNVARNGMNSNDQSGHINNQNNVNGVAVGTIIMAKGGGGGPRTNPNQRNGLSSSQTLHPVLQNIPQPKRAPPAIPPRDAVPVPVPPVGNDAKATVTLNTESTVANGSDASKTASNVVTAAPMIPSMTVAVPPNLNAIRPSKPPLRASRVVIGGHSNFIKKKASNEEDLPVTPDSPSDSDNDEISESLPSSAVPTPIKKGTNLSVRQTPISTPTQPAIDEKTESKEVHHDPEEEEPEQEQEDDDDDQDPNHRHLVMDIPNEHGNVCDSAEIISFHDPKAITFVQDHLEEILVKSYNALCTPHCRYVVLHELEREMKNVFRDTTPYELDPTDLNYVNFMQLLTMEMAKSNTVTVQIVCCWKKLISLKRGEQYVAKAKIRKHGREYDPCPEVETYVVITDKTNDIDDDDEDGVDGIDGVDEMNAFEKSAENNELKEDGDGIAVDEHSEKGKSHGKEAKNGKEGKDGKDGDDKLDAQIKESIAHLARCNVVHQMTPKDIYWHIKMLHSECSIATLETEFNRNNGHHNGRQQREPQNSFDEVAEELLQNGISGARILEMKWSDWEMLHELYRFDRDHQDFVDELIEDFFFPFSTAEMLSDELRVSGKQKFSRQSMFDSERVRPKLTLCVDYALFATITPILHYLVKLTDFEDCQRMLRLHKHLSVDEVVGEYSAMHIAAWRGKFKLLAALTKYGGDPMKINAQGETAFEAGQKHTQKLKWFYSEYPQYLPK